MPNRRGTQDRIWNPTDRAPARNGRGRWSCPEKDPGTSDPNHPERSVPRTASTEPERLAQTIPVRSPRPRVTSSPGGCTQQPHRPQPPVCLARRPQTAAFPDRGYKGPRAPSRPRASASVAGKPHVTRVADGRSAWAPIARCLAPRCPTGRATRSRVEYEGPSPARPSGYCPQPMPVPPCPVGPHSLRSGSTPDTDGQGTPHHW